MMASGEISLAIVGGGIGGLAAALRIRAGGRVHGSGRWHPNQSQRIAHFAPRGSCRSAGAEMGVKPLAWHQRRWNDGRTLLRTPLAEAMEAVFGFPHYQMHRGDVLAALEVTAQVWMGALGAVRGM
jgi:hypothetical protein